MLYSWLTMDSYYFTLFATIFFYSHVISRLLKKLDTNPAQHGVTFVLDDRFGLKQRRHCVAMCAAVCAPCSLAVALCTSLILLYVWLLARFPFD